MNADLENLLDELHKFGLENDHSKADRDEQMLIIAPDTGLFLSILIQATKSKSVLEVGTSNGYSTLWIADAVDRVGGKVTTVEISRKKMLMAKRNFERSGLASVIDCRQGDARSFLASNASESFDMIFLDADRSQYACYWNEIDRVLRVNGLLVVDNATLPRPEDLSELLRLVKSSKRYLMQTLAVGKGEMVALKLR